MIAIDTIVHRQHIRGSVEAWSTLEKARSILLSTARNDYVDPDAVLTICDAIQTEQDRLIQLRPMQP